MSKAATKNNLPDFIKLLTSAKNVLIIGHIRPDGDCLGSGFAIKLLCSKLGVQADFVCDSEPPEHYSFLPGFETLNIRNHTAYGLIICVDCADIARTGKYVGYLKSTPSVNIDHHFSNIGFCDYNLINPEATSACEVVFDLLEPYNVIDKEIAACLYTGLSTDTGHFMHNNVTEKTFITAAKLLSFGIEHFYITTKLYKQNTLGKIKLTSRAINSMRFFCDNKICIMTVKQADLDECGCGMYDTEGLVDYGMSLSSVLVTACISEQPTRMQYKVSYRSKSIDVAAAAAVFGGGGHKMAAGCMLSGQYEDVIDKIVKSITDGMD